MTSIQDVVTAAHRVKTSSEGVLHRTVVSADMLRQNAGKLEAVVKGSRTGEQAVKEVRVAERALRDCATKLLTMQKDIDNFIKDLTS
ncbi:MAG: hypothetical protein GX555_15480 [Actinomycetales bacterium]|mgnify:CR=1 FL=1|nr:hypothetical protein [Actinomycetales bacterium]